MGTAHDVIVVGGGIIGCSLALELADQGLRVAVIERGRVGQEASSAAAGILSAQFDLPAPGPLFELCQLSRRMYPGWIKQLERRSGIRVGFHVDGILYIAATASQTRKMQRQAAWQRRHGLTVEQWSGRDVRRREPSVDGAFDAGFYFPAEAQVDNVALMQALAVVCRKARVTVQEQTSVRAIVVRRGAVAGVRTGHGLFRAPQVVNCLGSWASLHGGFPLRIPVEPARGQMMAFQGPQRLFRHAVMSDRAYVVQRRDGRLLVGSTIERAGFEKALTLAGMHDILCGIRRLSSAMTRCTFLKAWAGFRPLTSDQLPILGATGIGGLYIATGHFRHGILLAPATAYLMREALLIGQASFDLSAFRIDRFRS